jgi:uncharacterized protein involved in exopolysaccharide biosynthesis
MNLGVSFSDALNAIFRKSYILKAVLLLLPLGTLIACLLMTPVYKTQAVLTVAKPPGPGGVEASASKNARAAVLRAEKKRLRDHDLWIETVKQLGTRYFTDSRNDDLSARVRKRFESLIGRIFPKKSSDGLSGSPTRPDYESLARSLNRRLSVTVDLNAGDLIVSFTYSNGKMAGKILDTHLRRYLTLHKESSGASLREPAARTVDAASHRFIPIPWVRASAVPWLTARSVADDRTSKNPPSDNPDEGTVRPGSKKDRLSARIEALELSIDNVTPLIAQYRSMQDALEGNALPSCDVITVNGEPRENTVLKELVTDLHRAMKRHCDIRERFVPSSRDFKASEARVNELTARLYAAVGAELKRLESLKTSLQDELRRKEETLFELERQTERVSEPQPQQSGRQKSQPSPMIPDPPKQLKSSNRTQVAERPNATPRPKPAASLKPTDPGGNRPESHVTRQKPEKPTADPGGNRPESHVSRQKPEKPADDTLSTPGTTSQPMSKVPPSAKKQAGPFGMPRVKKAPTVPESPIFPRTWLYVGVSFLLAFPVGIVLIFIANLFDKSFYRAKEIENATGLTVLATLRKLSDEQPAKSAAVAP